MVPEEFSNQTYGKLFRHLLERNLVAFGLYRLAGATDNKMAYCYTNPDPKTVVTHKDRVFVLGKEIPDDIALDIKRTSKIAGLNVNKERNSKKQLAKQKELQIAKESAEIFYGLREPPKPQKEEEENKEKTSSREKSAPPRPI